MRALVNPSIEDLKPLVGQTITIHRRGANAAFPRHLGAFTGRLIRLYLPGVSGEPTGTIVAYMGSDQEHERISGSVAIPAVHLRDEENQSCFLAFVRVERVEIHSDQEET